MSYIKRNWKSQSTANKYHLSTKYLLNIKEHVPKYNPCRENLKL